jgi:hypothetical protein
MDQFWWGFLAGSGPGIVVGIAVTIITIAVIRSMRTLPMGGRTYTGDLHTHPITQLFKDADHKGDR